ncbi:MAG: RNA polymerase sigma-54 factor, partial [Flavobacteriales bacterium]
MALKQRLQQKQLQRLSPQQIQLMKLLQVPTIALEQRIKEELEGNPALEEGLEGDEMDEEFAELDNREDEDSDDSAEDEFGIEDYLDDDDIPDYKLYANNSSADDEEKEVPLSGGKSFRDLLREQLGMRVLSDTQRVIAETIIGNLDDDGYLRREIFAIVDDLAFTQNLQTNEDEVEDLLDIIQAFEPAGVGARNLQECLLIQLNKKEETENVKLATSLITKMMDEFSKKHYTKICQRLHIDEEKLKEVLDEILKLNPRPGNSLSDSTKVIQNIVADFMITNEDGKLELTLNGRNAPELKVSNQYKQMLRTYSDAKGKANKEQKEAVQFVKQKLDGARWFID